MTTAKWPGSPRRRLTCDLPVRAMRVRVLLSVMMGCLVGGCATTSRPIFEPVFPRLEWPGHPMPPRIRYVGQLTSSADLKAQSSPFKSLGDFFVGKVPDSHLYGPRAVLSLPDKECLWVADPGGRCLHFFDFQNRSYKKILKMGKSILLSPVGLCAGPRNSIFVCDSDFAGIYRISDRTGELISELRLPEQVQRPVAIHFDEEEEEIYIVDASAHDIKVVTLDGTLKRIIGQRGNAPGEFNFPLAIAQHDDMIWVVDTGNYRIQGLKKTGEPVLAFGQAGDGPGDFALPKSIAVDSDGNLYIVDGRFENMQIFDPAGTLLLYVGREGRGPGEFWLPSGIAIDAKDRIWVCDSYNKRLQVFDYLGLAARQGRSEIP